MGKHRAHPLFTDEEQDELRKKVWDIKHKLRWKQKHISNACGAGDSYLSQIMTNSLRKTDLAARVVENLSILHEAVMSGKVGRRTRRDCLTLDFMGKLIIPDPVKPRIVKTSKPVEPTTTGTTAAIDRLAAVLEEQNAINREALEISKQTLEAIECNNKLLQGVIDTRSLDAPTEIENEAPKPPKAPTPATGDRNGGGPVVGLVSSQGALPFRKTN